ncbi:MAG: YidC/Oxa1 family membrane protein insertase [Fusobacterium sp.]|nr:YidC/Oxa1 family membrane protein insertase [Fusobacterium sp.]
MLDALFQIIIYPIYAALESSFYALYTTLNSNIALTILLISYIVFLFCLPLYLNAARLQHEEESIQAKMAARVNSIKKNFSGDEKHLLLQTYYRQNNYHPVMALRLSFSLLLQIPFFFGAYLFFSHLQIFNETALIGVPSLAEPDRLIKIGALSINFLPILMTLVNIAAAYVYTEDKSFKKNSQLYIMSLVFLVLLYNSPSGLVLYWTFNNFFSLIKNLGLRGMGEKAFVKCVMASALFIYYIIAKRYYLNLDIIIYILGLMVLAPKMGFVQKFLKDFDPKSLYFITCTALWLLVGVLIPSNVVATSPVEFTFLNAGVTPFGIMSAPALQALGLFLFWGGCFFVLSSGKTRKFMAFVSGLLLFYWILNAFLIPMPEHNLLSSLKFDAESVYFASPEGFVYPLCIAVAIIVFTALFLLARKFLKNLIVVVVCALVISTSANYVKIFKEFHSYKASVATQKSFDRANAFNLSTDNKNVLIIFLDRALGSYLPLVFNEKPELKDEFAGFVYYPNTVSMYGYTFLGYQAILGGYEYTPFKMAENTTDTVMDKYREALGMLPALFAKDGWQVTVSDTPGSDWNYDWLETDKLYTERGVNYKTVRGDLGSEYVTKSDLDAKNTKLTARNFLFYSLLAVSQPDMRNYIYNKGRYLNSNLIEYHSSYLLENYAELYYLPQLTGFSKGKNSLIVINNDLPHEPDLLYGPDYSLDDSLPIPEDVNGFNGNDHALKHYHVNAASLIMLGKYMQFLKENDVYDNTRIIIVSDHGREVMNPTFSAFANKYIMPYNPLFMVKDFNSNGEFKSSNEFMTNADVPYVAVQGLIKDARNPFTGKKILTDKKNGIYIKTGHTWQPTSYEGKVNPFEEDDKLHFVKDNIFDKNNWKLDIPYKKLKFMIK